MNQSVGLAGHPAIGEAVTSRNTFGPLLLEANIRNSRLSVGGLAFLRSYDNVRKFGKSAVWVLSNTFMPPVAF
jgi:hypothetical protein